MGLSDFQPIDFGALLPQGLPGAGFDQGFAANQQQQFAQAQQQREFAAQQQLSTARNAAIKAPSAENFNRLFILDPKSHEAIKAAHDAMDKDQQTSALKGYSSIRGQLAAGQPDRASELIQQRIDADKAAGLDTSDDEQVLELIKVNPKAAQGVVDMHLAAIIGPDKWADTFKTIGTERRATELQPGVLDQQGADLALTGAKTVGENADTAKTAAETLEIHPDAVADRGVKGAQVANYRSEIADRGARLAMARDVDGAEAPLSPEAVAMIGQQYLSQGAAALQNLGQGKTGIQNKNAIINWAAKTSREAGTTNPELVARFAANKANQAALTQNTKALTAITGSEHTLEANLDLAMGLAKKGVGPTHIPLLDVPINKARISLGSTDAKTLDNLLTTTANEYARILTTATGSGGGATSDAARAEANRLINSGMTLRQLTEAVKAAKAEAANRRVSIANESGRLVGEISGTKQPQQAPVTALPPSAHAALPAAPAPPTERKAGQVFDTPRGKMKWTGTGWLPAN